MKATQFQREGTYILEGIRSSLHDDTLEYRRMVSAMFRGGL